MRKCDFLFFVMLLTAFNQAEAFETCKPLVKFKISQVDGKKYNLQKLIDLANWVITEAPPIFSVTISQNGSIFYQLYTSDIKPDDAHYVMSITKSFTSALVGIAIDKKLLPGTDATITQVLPKAELTEEQAKKFSNLTLKQILGMSALNSKLYPSLNTDEARKLTYSFYSSPDRLKFALDQNLVAHPGEEFNYTDVTPILMTGALQFSTQKSLFDFAKENLFDPMGFKNEEWMHQDKRGFDNGAYGLRLRPLDMQKFGLLYLNSGCWEGRRLISQDWVKTSFNPWIRSRPKNHDPDYGWYWWKDWYSNGWIGHIANGWLGQRIIVFPEQKVVVTMTAEIHDGSEEKVVTNLMNQFVIPAIDGVSDNDGPKSSLNLSLKTSIKKASKIQKISPLTEYRMIPSTKMKEQHHLFKTED